jgi:O-acetyl-ADP-ribose deacetylase (regulator of RNase III)
MNDGVELARREIGGRVLVVVSGDLTTMAVDALVNAANEHLAHGGGLAAALARAGGPELDADSRRWIAEHGALAPGSAAVTTAGRMPATWVIHVVGPRYRPGQDNAALLGQAARAVLDTADELGAASVAMPAISAGIFGYPRREATAVIAREAAAWLAAEPKSLVQVRLVGYDDATAEDFAAAL